MGHILLSWIGVTDLRAPLEADAVGLGPVAQALAQTTFDAVALLSDFSQERTEPYLAWLAQRFAGSVRLYPRPLSSPVAFGEIYRAVVDVTEAERARDRAATFAFHLSPGTPAMAAIWLLVAKTRCPAELIESSREHGVRSVQVPFEISLDFLPDLLRRADQRATDLAAARAPEAPEFSAIVHRSDVMARLLERARKAALRAVPVLIEGESGTGKELLARAIHWASLRRTGPFVALNCGAIPAGLVESSLFGHERGAYTGADKARAGVFEAAHGGTLLLDEVGELSGDVQVRLLRVLQEHEVTRIGATRAIPVDVRIVAATHRSLLAEVAAGRFREDLFYRLAVALLRVPPLRDRPGDVGLLLDRLLAEANREAAADGQPGDRTLSTGARAILLGHSWPGNVRELLNTLRRLVMWSAGPVIEADEVRDALLLSPGPDRPDLLGRPLGEGFHLSEILGTVARHYLDRAMQEAGGNKSRAAQLVGLPSYQTLTNWLRRYGVGTGNAKVDGYEESEG
jgi:transcriptional regulator with PAS, ATPase and Fis domain